MINYVKSLGKIYQNSSYIATGFEHTGDTMPDKLYIAAIMNACKERFRPNGENADGRARVTADEERVLHVDWTDIRLCR